MIPVVRPEWIRESIKWGSAIPQRPFSPDPKFFFSQVYATVVGIEAKDTESILGILLGFGGQYSMAPRVQTTHVVTTDADHPYCKIAMSKNPSVKIVLPHWISDCCQQRKRLDESPYLLLAPLPEKRRISAKADNVGYA